MCLVSIVVNLKMENFIPDVGSSMGLETKFWIVKPIVFLGLTQDCPV